MSDEYFVYILQSEVTGRRYVGSCQDLADRLHRHNAGRSKSIKHGIPWKLIYSESFPTRSEAVHRERFFKTGKGREQLESNHSNLIALNVSLTTPG